MTDGQKPLKFDKTSHLSHKIELIPENKPGNIPPQNNIVGMCKSTKTHTTLPLDYGIRTRENLCSRISWRLMPTGVFKKVWRYKVHSESCLSARRGHDNHDITNMTIQLLYVLQNFKFAKPNLRKTLKCRPIILNSCGCATVQPQPERTTCTTWKRRGTSWSSAQPWNHLKGRNTNNIMTSDGKND